MFQFSRFASQFTSGSVGLPHSEILGSTLLCSSPKLIAALHVLLRLLMPRHPPCALRILPSQGMHRMPRFCFLYVLLRSAMPNQHASQKDYSCGKTHRQTWPLVLLLRLHHVKELSPGQSPKGIQKKSLPPSTGRRGASRSRTDDLLLARQAL